MQTTNKQNHTKHPIVIYKTASSYINVSIISETYIKGSFQK